MARTLDRPKVHPEVHPDIHPDIHPDVDEFISKTLEGETTTEQPRRPIRWMRWLAAALFVMAAAGVALIVVSRGDSDEAAPATGPQTAAVPSGSPYDAPMVEPQTATVPSGSPFDAPVVAPVTAAVAETIMVELPSGLLLEVPIAAAVAETIMVELPSGLLLEVPIAAAVAETMTVELPSGLLLEVPMVQPAAVEPAPVIARMPRTADGYELWHRYLDPRVPRSADGYEGWLLSTPVVERLGVDVLRIEDYMPPESTGAVYNYNPAPDAYRIEDYMPPESTGAVYNYNPVQVTDAVPSGSPFDATLVELPSVEVRTLPIAVPLVVAGDGALEVSYLPVTQVRPPVVAPETPVVLNVQPILVEQPDGIGFASVPRSADGLEGWILHLEPRVPRTADGAEGWITVR